MRSSSRRFGVLVFFPRELVPLMDRGSVLIHPDRLKNRGMFVRQAVMEKLTRMGLLGAKEGGR